MIIAKEIIDLCEIWSSSPVIQGNLVNVYENPGSTDYKELNKDTKRGRIRFIADNKSKIIFVWDAYLAIHVSVANKLWIEKKIRGSVYRNDLLLGEASLSGGGAKMVETDVFGHIDNLMKTVKTEKPLGYLKEYYEKYQEIFDIDWSWVYKYVDCQYLTDIKSKFDEIKELYGKNYDNSETNN